MYSDFFKLSETPFPIAPDAHFFLSNSHREALAHLMFSLQSGGGFVMLTGEIGTGKTMVAQCFMEQAPPVCRFAIVQNPLVSVTELLHTICEEFDLRAYPDPLDSSSSKHFFDTLNEYLIRSHSAGQRNILVVDEAQNLSPDALEQLRLLTNLETHKLKLLQIVLIGQPKLRELLRKPEWEQVAQRVIARVHLGTLSETEVRPYLGHRLKVAGYIGPLPFSDEAVSRLFELTQGVPRRINQVCDQALHIACSLEIHQVDLQLINQSADDVFDMAVMRHAAKVDFLRSSAYTSWMFLALGALIGTAATTTAFTQQSWLSNRVAWLAGAY
jgi:general secretion pathway protein A